MGTILISDNDASMRQLLKQMLEPEGHRIISAEDGAQTLSMTSREHIELILLDMHLPDMESNALLTELRQRLPDVPIIMVCGFGDIETAMGSIKKGAFDYISKPFQLDEVLKLVQKVFAAQSAQTSTNQNNKGKRRVSPNIFHSFVHASGIVKYALIGIVVIGVAAEIVLFTVAYVSSQITNQIFEVPYSNPTALSYDGTYLWITDWVTQSFYQHNIDKNLSMIHTYFIQDSHPSGIASDGTHIWSSNAWESLIFKHTMDQALTIIESYQSPGPEPSGLYWDGLYLWICDLAQAKIYKTKVGDEGLVIIDSFESPGADPIGIFSDGSYFWIGDAQSNQIFKLNQEFTVVGVYQTPVSDKESKLSSVGWDGKSLWVCTDKSSKIYRNSLKSLRKIK